MQAYSPTSKPNGRMLTEIQTAKVELDSSALLSNEYPTNPDNQSPRLRGGKLNMKNQASVKAMRGVDGSPRAQNNKSLFGPKQQFITQPFTVTNSPKKKTQLHGVKARATSIEPSL